MPRYYDILPVGFGYLSIVVHPLLISSTSKPSRYHKSLTRFTQPQVMSDPVLCCEKHRKVSKALDYFRTTTRDHWALKDFQQRFLGNDSSGKSIDRFKYSIRLITYPCDNNCFTELDRDRATALNTSWKVRRDISFSFLVLHQVLVSCLHVRGELPTAWVRNPYSMPKPLGPMVDPQIGISKRYRYFLPVWGELPTAWVRNPYSIPKPLGPMVDPQKRIIKRHWHYLPVRGELPTAWVRNPYSIPKPLWADV